MTETQAGYTQALTDILNSRLARDITDAYNHGIDYEHDRITRILKIELANDKDKLEQILFLINDVNVI